MTDRDLDEIIILYWPSIMRQTMAGTDDRLKGFVRSIARAAKRRDWRPSEKQAWVMCRLVAELNFSRGGETEVIER